MSTLTIPTLYFMFTISLVVTYPAGKVSVKVLDRIGNDLNDGNTLKHNGHRNSRLGSKHFRHWSSFPIVSENNRPGPNDLEKEGKNEMMTKDSEDNELDSNLDEFLAWTKTAPPQMGSKRGGMITPMISLPMVQLGNRIADYCLTCIPPSCPSGTVRSQNGNCVPTANW